MVSSISIQPSGATFTTVPSALSLGDERWTAELFRIEGAALKPSALAQSAEIRVQRCDGEGGWSRASGGAGWWGMGRREGGGERVSRRFFMFCSSCFAWLRPQPSA